MRISPQVPALRIRFLAVSHTTLCLCHLRAVSLSSARLGSTPDRPAGQDGFLTARQIVKRYGEDQNHADAQAMLESAIARGNVRPNPDCPDRKETVQR